MSANDVFQAIAHPARRQILDRLLSGEATVGELAEPFDISRPAVSQHLRVLRDAGLVTERREGRQRYYRIEPEPLEEVRAWLASYDQFWQDRLASLGRFLADRDAAEERSDDRA
ncbi:MAG TPA: metalloregulator ArsR/SmtB family transcription factor [Thermomicrobiales bacterium]|nr:metalloregulator ArsR/SmtB family transcription factor [Thermomicrobiales bacterium]